MSEDVAQAPTDGAGIWRDPSGALTIGESGSEHYELDHGVTVVCDSSHGLIARMSVRAEAKKSKRPRIMCPAGCGRMATIYVRGARQ